MKTSRIISCTFDKAFDSKFGKLYQHTVTLENKDSGQINAKEEMPDWLERGKELNYEITPNGKYPDKLKRVNPKFASTTNSNPSGITIEDMERLTERINKLEEVIKGLVKANKLIYVAPKPVHANNDVPF